MNSRVSRPFNFSLALAVPLVVAAALLLVEPTALDFAIERLFYSPAGGFVGRHSFWLEDILHDRLKQLVILIGVLAIGGFLISLLPATPLRPWRRALGYLVLALALSTSIVTPLKKLTGMHCPWSLSEFGGVETYSPLLGERAPAVREAGRCWPGGHASAGFSLLALFFFLRDRHPRAARAALLAALALGSLMALGRMMQGAHFLSHNVWTLLFDWLICLGSYRLLLYRPAALPADG